MNRHRVRNWRRPLRRLICALSQVLILTLPAALARGEQPLQAGDWTGKFRSHGELEAQNLLYEVSYDEDKLLHIQMINLSLEPRAEHIYELSEIETDDDKIRFTVVKRFETLQCELTREEEAYIGSCKSDFGDPERSGDITLSPPATEE